MRMLIFAGGSGRRLWPISRQKSPKQFEPIIGDESTLQLAVRRVLPVYGAENIYVSTNAKYVDLVRQQLPQLDESHFIAEPERRDLGAAVGLAMAHVAYDDATEPVAILWSDNTIENEDVFVKLLAAAERLVASDEADILFLGETPQFANANLGWLKLGHERGQVDGLPYFGFESLTYRPSVERCEEMFASGGYVWNTGFFVTTPDYVRGLYAEHMPQMSHELGEIEQQIGRAGYEATLERIYPTLQAISFDDAILTHVDKSRALVLHSNMGWSDPGTLYALKATVQPDEEQNATMGRVVDKNSRDSLIYNYEPEKLVMAIGLDGYIVVNTEDALLVVHKDDMPLLKKAVDGLEGSDLESFS
jgi:mannose-1-phosphate guanylyltransferase